MTVLLIHLTVTLAASVEGEAAPLLLLLLGPAGAGGMYWGIYRYYRNTHQSHAFETETIIEAQPVTGFDRVIKRITRTSRSEIQGGNEDSPRKRVTRVAGPRG